MSRRRRTINPDFIRGVNFPVQTYAWSGMQWSPSQEAVNGKRPTSSSPMSITSQPPGAFAKDDESWQLTFGASHDCVLALMNGRFLEESSIGMSILGIYRDALPNVQDFNLYRDAGDAQQIQYIVSKNSVEEARAAVNNAGTEGEARGIAMRSPLMMAGYGKTVGIRPTDPMPTTDSNKRKNDDEHKTARETWKHGPIDFRWDERRGTWSAFNDLIADHEGKNLGTLVFSTNPDEACGFPFLKGKLQDVWRVLRTKPYEDADGTDDDFTQTAEICTVLEHNWYDEVDELYAPLNSIFKIHRKDEDVTPCGSETANLGCSIEILTSAFFHMSDTKDGPACFSAEDIEDNELVGCMKFQEGEGGGDGCGIPGQWVPAIPFDPCKSKFGLEQFNTTFANDKVLADGLIEICKMMLECLGKSPKGGQGEAMEGLSDTQTEAGDAAQGASESMQGWADSLPGGPTDSPAAKAKSAANAAADAQSTSAGAFDDAAQQSAEAGAAQNAADTAARDLAEASSTASDTQSAHEAAQSELSSKPNDPSTQQTAEQAAQANEAAQASESQAQSEFNQANTDAQSEFSEAQDAADGAAEAQANAEGLVDEAAALGEDAGTPMPEDVKNDARDAKAAGDKAQAEADNALPDTPPTIEELAEKLAAKCDEIDALNDIGEGTATSIGGSMQKNAKTAAACTAKALADLASQVENALSDLSNDISLVADAAGVSEALASTTRARVTPPPQEQQDVDTPDIPTPSSLNPTTTEGTDGSSGGSVFAPGTKTGGPGTKVPPGGPTSTPGPPPEPPPTCPIIVITDPCSNKKSSHGPCPGGKGGGTGQSGDDGGDKGEGEGVNDAGFVPAGGFTPGGLGPQDITPIP